MVSLHSSSLDIVCCLVKITLKAKFMSIFFSEHCTPDQQVQYPGSCRLRIAVCPYLFLVPMDDGTCSLFIHRKLNE